MLFEEGKKFSRMYDMSIPHFEDSEKYVFFEPRPSEGYDEGTLEGCLA